MSDKLPAFQFYPGDWRKDPSIQACSLTARGLWTEMLCLMHESARRGYLELNDRPVTPEQLARMVGASAEEVAALLAELEGAGVFSRDGRGVIYSRRMDKDEHIRRVRSEAGKLGSVHGHKGGRPRKDEDGKRQKRQTKPLPNGEGVTVSGAALSSGGEEPDSGGEEAKTKRQKRQTERQTKRQTERQNNPPSSSSSSSSSECIAASAADPVKARKRNPLFDAIAEVTSADPVINGSHIGKVASLLSQADPPFTPEEVRELGARWRQLLPWATPEKFPVLTLGTFEKHVSTLRAAARATAPEPSRAKRAGNNFGVIPELAPEM